ncbi:MAG: PAS domain S-box protein [Candidatus Heimdallarchaeota archaeon]
MTPQNSKDLYQAVVEQLPLGVTIFQDKRLVFANPAAKNITGYSVNELLALSPKELNELIHPEDRGYFWNGVLKQFTHDQAPAQYEYRIITKQGEIKWIEGLIRIIEYNGQPAAQGTLIDISDRKEAEKELRKSEEKYRDLLININEAVYLISEDGIITYISPSIESMIGFHPSEMIGKAFLQFILPGEEQQAMEIMKEVLAGHLLTREYRIFTKAGDVCWVRASNKPIIVDDKVIGINGIATDITKEKQAEEALRASEKWFRSIFERAPIAIGLYDSTGIILGANQACLEIMGASSLDDLEGFSFFDEPTMTDEIREKILKKEFHSLSYRTIYDFDEVRQRNLYATEKTDIAYWEITITSLIEDPLDHPKWYLLIIQDITDQKVAEQYLQESEALYRGVVQDQTELVCRFLPGGILTFVNDAFCRYFKKTRGKLVGTSFFRLLLQEERESMKQRIDSLTLKKPVITTEVRGQMTNGTERWQQWTNRAIFDQQEDIFEYQGVGRDITERKKAEEALRESENKYRTLVETSHEGITLTDLEGHILFANQQAILQTGYNSEEDIVGMNALDFVSLDDRALAMENIQKTLAKGSIKNMQHSLLKQDGTQFPAELNAALILDENGEPSNFVVFIKDITERKRTEEELRKFKTIADAASYGVEIISPEGQLLYLNEAFSQMHGYTHAEDLVGKNFSVLHTNEQMIIVEKLREQLFQEGNYVAEEVWHQRKDGSVFPTLMTGNAIRDESGNPLYLSATAIDISERKRAEETIRESAEIQKTLLNAFDDTVMLADLEGIIFAINNKGAERLGKRPDELVGRCIFDFLPAEASEARKKRGNEVVILKKSLRYEDSRAGIFFDNIVSPIFNARGEVEKLALVARDTTSQKLMEKALREGEKKYRTVVEQSLQGIAIIHSDKIQFANPAFTEMIGYSLEELSDITAEAILHPDDRERALKLLGERFAGKPISPTHQYRLIRKDKSIAWVETFATLIEFEGKKAAQIAFIDITDRKKVEEALRKSEEQFRLLAENAQDLIFRVQISPTFRYEYMGPAVEKNTGYRPEDYYKDPMLGLKMVHPDDKPFLETLRKNPVFDDNPVIIRWVHKDGTIQWTEDRSTPVYDEGGNLIAVEGVSRNITGQKKAEEALRKSEHEKALILQSTSDVIVYQDRYLNVIWANKAASEYIGLTPEEMAGKYCYEVWRQRTEPCEDCPVRDALETGKPQQRENITPDGRMWIDRGYPVRNDEGEMIGAVEVATDITDRRMAEEALRESEEKYRALVEQSVQGLAIVQDGQVVFANPRLEEISGYTFDEISMLPPGGFLNVVHPEDREIAGRIVSQRLAGIPLPPRHEFRILRKDGTVSWVETFANLTEYDGKPSIQATYIDVTDRKQAEYNLRKSEEALRESEEKYRTFVQNFLGIAYRADLETWTPLFFHGAVEAITGYTEEELVAGNPRWDEVIHPDDFEKIHESAEKIRLVPGFSTEREYRIVRKDGQIRWILELAQNIWDDSETPIFVQGALYDITERKQADQALRMSEERFRTIFQESNDGVALVNITKDGHLGFFVEANNAFCHLTGLDSAEIAKFVPRDLVTSDEYDRLNKEGVIGSWLSDDPIVFEAAFLSGDETEVLVEVNAPKVILDDKQFRLMIIHDITERRQAEEVLQAQKEELSEFVHAMAHDLRSKIHNIQGYASLLEEEPEPALAQTVVRLAQSMNDLLVRSVALADAGQVIDKSDTINLSALIQRIGDAEIPSSIEFYSDEFPSVACDAEKVAQIFQNLLANAVIHGKPKKIRVIRDDTAGNLELVIRNDGEPIPEQKRSQIFDRGFTTQESRTGLGLAIVKKLVEAHGWQIRIEDTPETAFRISIPTPNQ